MKTIDRKEIIAHRMKIHNLNAPVNPSEIVNVIGVCGFQYINSRSFEYTLKVRMPLITLDHINDCLYNQKTLVHTWAMRGVPFIIPSRDISVFLHSLIPEDNETWIYTQGMDIILKDMVTPFDQLLKYTQDAIRLMRNKPIVTKKKLDRFISNKVVKKIEKEDVEKWNQPLVYGKDQCLGEAIVSFLLRPCAIQSKILFGERKALQPSFTSFQNWFNKPIKINQLNPQELVYRYLHAYGPATLEMFMLWSGVSYPQAKRLFYTAQDQMEEVLVNDKVRFILKSDFDSFQQTSINPHCVILPPYDPYLDIRDRSLLIESKKLQKLIWKSAHNPGVIILHGEIVGIWINKLYGTFMNLELSLFQELYDKDLQEIHNCFDQMVKLHDLHIKEYQIKYIENI